LDDEEAWVGVAGEEETAEGSGVAMGEITVSGPVMAYLCPVGDLFVAKWREAATRWKRCWEGNSMHDG